MLATIWSTTLVLRAWGVTCLMAFGVLAKGCVAPQHSSAQSPIDGPYVIVLGTAQDAGSPQINSPADHPARLDPSKRRFASSLGIVDPATGQRWLIEATPDIREQAWILSRAHPEAGAPIELDGVFITHAHIGHYTGLVFLGHESMGASRVPTYVAPKMAEFLESNGPWDLLLRRRNIELRVMDVAEPIDLGIGVTVTPFLVPHRQEYSEVVGFRIDGPNRSVLFIPDIDSWDELAEMGVDLLDLVRGVDRAYLDGTFYDDNEIPGRDMSTFPHPRITDSMDRLEPLRFEDRERVRFLHLNHTNPAQWQGTEAREEIERRGFRVAERGRLFAL